MLSFFRKTCGGETRENRITIRGVQTANPTFIKIFSEEGLIRMLHNIPYHYCRESIIILNTKLQRLTSFSFSEEIFDPKAGTESPYTFLIDNTPGRERINFMCTTSPPKGLYNGVSFGPTSKLLLTDLSRLCFEIQALWRNYLVRDFARESMMVNAYFLRMRSVFPDSVCAENFLENLIHVHEALKKDLQIAIAAEFNQFKNTR